jgi:hypothetical protein
MQRALKTMLLCMLSTFVLLAWNGGAIAAQIDNPTITFKDVSSSDANAIYITYLANQGLINGFPDGTYRPAEGLTRAQAAVLFCQAGGISPVGGESTFSDVSSDHWAAPYITAAAQAGYITGFPDGSFHPEESLSRCQGMSLFLRLTHQSLNEAELPPLLDIDRSHWAAPALATALAAGMIETVETNAINPDQPLNRGDLARALSLLLTQAPDLNQRELIGSLKVQKGTVELIKSGSNKAQTLSTNSTITAGDTVTTGQDSRAEINFPDGSGILLESNSVLKIKQSLGRAYIKKDGTPGIAVDDLEIELTNGRLFGALASQYTASDDKSQDQTALQNRYRQIASRDERYYLMAAENPNSWYKTAQSKKVKVQVDMPWGVAAIRGSFWSNSVNSNSCTMSLLEGDGSLSSGGQTQNLSPGQSSGIGSVGAPPAPPTAMGPSEAGAWLQQANWVMERASDMQNNQGAEGSPGQNDQAGTPPNPWDNLTNTLNNALNQISQNAPGVQPSTQDSGKSGDSGNSGSNPEPSQVAVPTPSTGAGTYNTSQNVSLSTATAGAIIYYTTDGSDPRTSSTRVLYSAPINISETITIKAYAVKDNMSDSDVVSFTYIIDLSAEEVAAPTASPGSGTYEATVSVSLSTATPGAAIYYTIDGSDPKTSSTRMLYSTSISIENTSTLKAYAVKAGMSDSEVASYSYIINTMPTGYTLQMLDLQRVSVNSDGTETTAALGYICHSSEPSISADGRYVAFCSYASNLVADDTNNAPDIFVKDVIYGTVTRVSVTTAGAQSNGAISDMPQITPDGRYVVFRSGCTNLATGNPADDTNGNWDIFVHDRDTDGNGIYDEAGKVKTIRVSINNAGEQTNHSNFGNSYPSISDDGRFVCFSSDADNLGTGDTNNRLQIYVHDRDADGNGIFDEPGGIATNRVSMSNSGIQADQDCYDPKISGNGRYIVFSSGSTNLVEGITSSFGIYLYDLQEGAISWLTQGGNPHMSYDGRYVAFKAGDSDQPDASDTNECSDIYVLDRNTDSIQRISVSDSGDQANDDCRNPLISPEGRFVTFVSTASNLVPNDTNESADIFIYDRQNRYLKRLSTNPWGIEANMGSYEFTPVVDGRYVAYSSEASNLVSDDSNNEDDVFLAIIDPDAIIEDIPPDPDQITVMNNATGNDLVRISFMGNNALFKVYDAAVGGNLIAQDISMEGSAWITIEDGFPSALNTIYVSATPYGGTESSRTAKAIPIPPVMDEGTDYSVDTVDCGYGKIAYKVTADQKAAIEASTGTVIDTVKAYTTCDIETTFSDLADAEATNGVVVPIGDIGVAVSRDPGNYGYAIAAYDVNDQVVAYYVSGTWETVWSGPGVNPNTVNASDAFDQTFTLSLPADPYSAGTFKDTDLSSYITLEGLFDGLAVGTVTRISSTQITVQVTGNLTQTGYYGKICIAADALENAPEPGGAVRQVAEIRVLP